MLMFTVAIVGEAFSIDWREDATRLVDVRSLQAGNGKDIMAKLALVYYKARSTKATARTIKTER